MNLLSHFSDLTPPRPQQLLPDIPGGAETNLLPVTALQADLRVDLDVWEPVPTPQLPHTLSLRLGGRPVNSKIFVDLVDPHVMLPKDSMVPGIHQLDYTVETDSGESFPSSAMTLTIDTSAPTFATSSQVVFPSDMWDGITLDYLTENDDKVVVTVPQWPEIKPGDSVHWYWGLQLGNPGTPTVMSLDAEAVAQPITVELTKVFLDARGNGTRYMSYRLADRAGNITSGYSIPVQVEVDLTEVPRDLPAVSVIPFA